LAPDFFLWGSQAYDHNVIDFHAAPSRRSRDDRGDVLPSPHTEGGQSKVKNTPLKAIKPAKHLGQLIEHPHVCILTPIPHDHDALWLGAIVRPLPTISLNGQDLQLTYVYTFV
jgi:hypothetical protein